MHAEKASWESAKCGNLAEIDQRVTRYAPVALTVNRLGPLRVTVTLSLGVLDLMETWAIAVSNVWSIVELSQIFRVRELDSKFMRHCFL